MTSTSDMAMELMPTRFWNELEHIQTFIDDVLFFRKHGKYCDYRVRPITPWERAYIQENEPRSSVGLQLSRLTHTVVHKLSGTMRLQYGAIEYYPGPDEHEGRTDDNLPYPFLNCMFNLPIRPPKFWNELIEDAWNEPA